MATGGSEMTLVSLDGIDFTDYAVRGITAVVSPIELQAALMRDINGTLADVSDINFRKLDIQLSCSDVEAPDFSAVWTGTPVTVTLMPGVGADGNTSGQLTVDALVVGWSVNRDEWGCVSDWTLKLSEV